jgi:hypothetical protein
MSRFFLFLFIAASALAQVPPGATKQQVIETLGWPDSSSAAGSREILNYPEYSIFLLDGQVQKLERKPVPQKNQVRPRSTTDNPAGPTSKTTAAPSKRAPTPEELLGPNQGRQDNRPQLKTEPVRRVSPVTQPTVKRPQSEPKRPSEQRRPTTNPFAPFRNMVILIVLIFAVLMGLSWWLRAQASRRRDDVFFGTDRNKSPPLVSPKSSAAARPDPLKDGWSIKLLRSIEWHRFEHLVAAYEREMGHDAELTSFGADGGIDIVLFPAGSRTPSRIIQCKAFTQQKVGVDLVRAFYGVMTLRKIPKGSFYTTGSFSDDAFSIGLANENLDLVDGQTFLNRIQRLQLSAQLRLFEIATEGDYTTPTCASCGVKMILKTAEKGRDAGSRFWGCRNYPRCRSTLKLAQP